jgi:hypothetical protein
MRLTRMGADQAKRLTRIKADSKAIDTDIEAYLFSCFIRFDEIENPRKSASKNLCGSASKNFHGNGVSA